jgi:predicted RNA-binding Zn-ribbon protein involved in translation (DUF1610 family)
MAAQFQLQSACENLTHRNTRISIRHCPACGEIVNTLVAARQCSEQQHAEERRRRTGFCPDCGTRLLSPG